MDISRKYHEYPWVPLDHGRVLRIVLPAKHEVSCSFSGAAKLGVEICEPQVCLDAEISHGSNNPRSTSQQMGTFHLFFMCVG